MALSSGADACAPEAPTATPGSSNARLHPPGHEAAPNHLRTTCAACRSTSWRGARCASSPATARTAPPPSLMWPTSCVLRLWVRDPPRLSILLLHPSADKRACWTCRLHWGWPGQLWCRHSDADQDPVVLVGFRICVAAADQLCRQRGPRMLLQYTKPVELLYPPQTAACSMRLLEVSRSAHCSS